MLRVSTPRSHFRNRQTSLYTARNGCATDRQDLLASVAASCRSSRERQKLTSTMRGAALLIVALCAVGALADEPKKKKYAKEAWPGKKPTPSLLV